MKAEEEVLFNVNKERNANSISSPDSESSFVEENDKIPSKPESSPEDTSEESTASSLKRKLRNIPSPSESSSFCERSIVSARLRRERDFFYHLQELSNSIEEKDEAEVSSASSGTRISSTIRSKLQNPRARRRAKMLEASKNYNSYLSKPSAESDKESVSKSPHGSLLKSMPQKTKNQEYSECSRNSSRCEDSSGGRLRSNRIDFDEDGKLSNRSNATSSGERKRSLYRNEVKVDAMTSPLSPSSPLIFPGTFPILSKNIKPEKKIGGYRPTSVLFRNLSSESESDTGNDKILQNLMIERCKARDDLAKLQSRGQNLKSSIESSLSSTKIKKPDYIPRKEAFFNPAENSTQIIKSENDLEKISKNQKAEKNPVFIYSSASDRSDPSDMDHHVTRIPSLVILGNKKIFEENAPFPDKSSGKAEMNSRKENSSIQDDKGLRVPTLQIRSQDLSPSNISSKEKEDQQSLDMKALVSALSDVSLKQENAFGDSGKSRAGHSGDKQISARSSLVKNKTAFPQTPTRIPEIIVTKANQSKKMNENEPIKNSNQALLSSTEKNFDNSKSKRTEEVKIDSPLEKYFSQISRFEKHVSSSKKRENFSNTHETLTSILTSRTEYSDVRQSQDKRSVRSFELAYLDKKTETEEPFCSMKYKETYIGEPKSEVLDEKKVLPVKDVSSNTTFIIKRDKKSKDSGIIRMKENSNNTFSSKSSSSTGSCDQENNNFEKQTIPSDLKMFSALKIDPISVVKESEELIFESNILNAFIPPRTSKGNFFQDPNKCGENSTHRSLNKLFSESMHSEEVPIQLVTKSSEEISQNCQCEVENQNNKEVISDDSLTNDFMIKSYIEDSNQLGQRKREHQKEQFIKCSQEVAEPHFQQPKTRDSSINNKVNNEFGKDIKSENLSFNLIERSASFNSMKLAKSDRTEILSRNTDNKNLPAKSSASMSKLSCLLDSMKKETQDRFPFTISESASQNSSKFKVEKDPDDMEKSVPKVEDAEVSYKLDIQSSITRLALSDIEPLPSELKSCVSNESPPQTLNFLPRMKGYVRKFSIRLKNKKRSKDLKSTTAKILFKNSECHVESTGSSGDTMELQSFNEETNGKQCYPLRKTTHMEVNPKSEPIFLGVSDKRDRNDLNVQPFVYETENSRYADVRSCRTKSSPVDIKNRRTGFSRMDESESEYFQELGLKNKQKESLEEKSFQAIPKVDVIKVEVQELPSQIGVDSNCFCFKFCRTLVHPSVASPGNVYLPSRRSKPGSKKF